MSPGKELAIVLTIELGKDKIFKPDHRTILEKVLRDYAPGQRWFRGKARETRSVGIEDVLPMRFGQSEAYFTLAKFEYDEGAPDIYVVPLVVTPAGKASQVINEHPQAIVANLEAENTGQCLLYDAMVDKAFCNSLLEAIGEKLRFRGESGEIVASPTRVFRDSRGSDRDKLDPVPTKAEQSNTSIVFGDRLILKLFRRLDKGLNPEHEMGRFLTEKTSFKHIPQVAGAIEYKPDKGNPISLAILQDYIVNEGDAWKFTLKSLERYFLNVSSKSGGQLPSVPREHLLFLPQPPPLAREIIGPYLSSAQLLGQRTAELHIALASDLKDPDFAPEYFTPEYQTSLYQSMRDLCVKNLHLLRDRLGYVSEELREDARRVLSLENDIGKRYRRIRENNIPAARIRCHGDYHLGQVLFTGEDFVIIDFEGEPARSLDERRMKRSPLLDVAGMIRSFHYAVHSILLQKTTTSPDESTIYQHRAQYWHVWVAAAFLSTYFEVVEPAGLLPENPDHLRILLDAYILDKAIYELGYELNNRPDWLRVPLQGILRLMESGG